MKIKTMNQDSFARYGRVIETQMTGDGDFEVIIDEPDYGWRIATYHVTRKSTKNLERHPTSKESFEPLQGIGLLIVANVESPQHYEVFLLDKSVCLYEGIWHQLISLSDATVVKITENIEVSSEFYEFKVEVTPAIIGGE